MDFNSCFLAWTFCRHSEHFSKGSGIMIHEESDTKSTHEMRARSSSNPAEDLQWVSPAHQNTLPRRKLNNSSAESAAALLKSNNENNLRLWAAYQSLSILFACQKSARRRQSAGKKLGEREARELCRVQKLFDRDIIRDAPARLNAMPRAACQKFAFKLAMKGRKWKSSVDGFKDAQNTTAVVRFCSRHGLYSQLNLTIHSH